MFNGFYSQRTSQNGDQNRVKSSLLKAIQQYKLQVMEQKIYI